MSTTLQIESFSDTNLAGQPRATLPAAVAGGADTLVVESTENFEPGQIVLWAYGVVRPASVQL